MTVRYDDRVAIVTGAGGGLGRSHALKLAELGARVVVNDPAPLKEGQKSRPAELVASEIQQAGGQAVANFSSVTNADSAAEIVEQAMSAFGRLDVLINNAGFLRDKSFGKMSSEDFDAVVGVHLAGAAYCTMAAWGPMREAGYGRIVFTTSNSGLYGNFGQANYGAGKAGLIGLMNVLKIEGAKYGILVNTVAPMAATPMTEAVMDAATKARFAPELVSSVVAFMGSDAFGESGRIISTAGGHVAAVEVVTSGGALLDATAARSPDEVLRHWREITDFSASQRFREAKEEIDYITAKIQSGQ